MQNAHPQIMLNMARVVSRGNQFPYLEMYCASYDACRSCLSDYLGTSQAAAKIANTKLFYGAMPIAEHPHIMNSTSFLRPITELLYSSKLGRAIAAREASAGGPFCVSFGVIYRPNFLFFADRLRL